MNMLGDIEKKALETAMSTAEDTFSASCPWYIKIFYPCNGCSAIEALNSFKCIVPEDKKPDFEKAYNSYADAKKQLKVLA